MLSEGALLRAFKHQAEMAGVQVQCAGAGDPHAQIAIISEAPGQSEVDAKMPQYGAGGRLLWEALRPYGISRTNVWTTNVCKRQLLERDDTKATINNNELAHWHALLTWELSQLPNLRYILCLGNMALEYLTKNTGILKWRGTVTEWHDKKVIITVNPALIIREPKWGIVFRFDMNKLKKVLDGRWKEHIITAHINPTPIAATRWINRMANEGLPIACDIETAGGETVCIGLANDAHDGMCINFRSPEGNHYSEYEERFIRRRLAELFSDHTVKTVWQNAAFDCSWLWFKDHIRVANNWFDTLLAHHTLYPQLPHNLGFLTAQYTNHPYYKDDKDALREGGDYDTYWRYNVKDCCITKAVQLAEHNELISQQLDRFFFDHVMQLQPWLVNMTALGVKADTSLKEKLTDELRAELDQLLASFHEAVHDATGDREYNPNPLSPKQLAELFFTRLRLVGRGTSTDEINRQRMLAHPRTSSKAKHAINLCNRYKTEHKFVSTYTDTTIDSDGRWRTLYKQFGTQSAPGRLSSSATDWDTGGNLQNIPERAKVMFTADEGHRFVYFDLSQAEARVVAWLANIASWKEQFERARLEGGYDCHRALASEMFNVPYDQTPKEDTAPTGERTIRYIAKRCRHGLNYRMGPEKLADVTGLPISQAMEAYRIYHRITPELKVWWESLINEVKRTKQLWTPMGRRWVLLERFDDDALESVVAFKPQSTIGDKVSQVIYQAQSDRDWPDHCHVLLNVHDALIAITPDDDRVAARTLRVLRRYAESPIVINGEQLIIPADIAWSVPDDTGTHRWSTITKIKDPRILAMTRDDVQDQVYGLSA